MIFKSKVYVLGSFIHGDPYMKRYFIKVGDRFLDDRYRLTEICNLQFGCISEARYMANIYARMTGRKVKIIT